MIDASVLPFLFTTILFLAISPGPDLVLISSYSSTKGMISGVMISLGILLAGMIQTGLVAFGLGELMMFMPNIALAIKLVGALYLSYLGVKMLRNWYQSQRRQQGITPEQTRLELLPDQKRFSHMSLLYKGLLNNLLNPKALLFFSLFLPQFTNSNSTLTSQILLLGLMLSLCVFIINLLFALGFSQLGKRVGRHVKLGKHIDGLLGLIFVGLAARLATRQ